MGDDETIKLLQQAVKLYGIEPSENEEGEEGISIPISWGPKKIEKFFKNIAEYVKHGKNIH